MIIMIDGTLKYVELCSLLHLKETILFIDD